MKTFVRGIGGLGSAFSAGFVTTYLDIPHGVTQTSFIACAALSAIAGYYFGLWAGSNKAKRAVYGVAAAIIQPFAMFSYYLVLNTAWPGILTVGLLYLLFVITFLVLFIGLGILQVKIIEG
jgi:hypothetical protein